MSKVDLKVDVPLDNLLLDALQSTSEAFAVYNSEGNLQACNNNFRELYKYSEEEAAPGTHFKTLFLLDIKNKCNEAGFYEEDFEECLAFRITRREQGLGKFEMTLEDGRTLYVSERATSSGGIVSIQRDITERKELETALRRSSRLFEAAFNANMSSCSISVLETGKFLNVNNAWCETTGYTREEAIGKTSVELNIWGSENNRKELVRLIGENATLREFRSQIRTRDGEIRILSMNSDVFVVDGVKCLFLAANDITEAVETELALFESRDRLASFADASMDWYWELDKDLHFSYISPNVEDSTGFSAADYVGEAQIEVFSRNVVPGENLDRLFDVLKNRKPFRDIVVCRLKKDTNEKVWVRIGGQPFYDSDGEFLGFRGASADITEQVKLEEHLQQAQKMEAVGQLTGGVAHDFNNLLAVIQGNGELLREQLEGQDERWIRHVDAIMRAALRGAELTNSMLAFSRKQTLVPTVVRLTEQVDQMVTLMSRTLGEDVEIVTDLASNVWDVTVDPGKLENAVLNLCINARDAMPQGGKLTIKLQNIEIGDKEREAMPEVQAGRYVKLSITDTGCGIAPEDLPHVLEPFYTTKEVGKGTGLGLSMVYGFAHQSNGHMDVQSEVGKGTTVNLYLPVHDVVSI